MENDEILAKLAPEMADLLLNIREVAPYMKEYGKLPPLLALRLEELYRQLKPIRRGRK